MRNFLLLVIKSLLKISPVAQSLNLYPVSNHVTGVLVKNMSCTDTHLADRLELLVVLVVAGQKEAPVGARPLAFSQIGANHTQVHCVAHPL